MKRITFALTLAGVVWLTPLAANAQLPEGCVAGEMDVVCTLPDTVPDTTWQSLALTDVCIQHITGGPTLQPGEYVYVDSVDKATGTTERFVGLCAPVPTVPPSLPATGGETGWIALAAVVTLLTGISLVGTVRRS